MREQRAGKDRHVTKLSFRRGIFVRRPAAGAASFDRQRKRADKRDNDAENWQGSSQHDRRPSAVPSKHISATFSTVLLLFYFP